MAISKFIHLGKGWECLLRACLHGSVGVQVGEVSCLGGVTRRSHNVSFEFDDIYMIGGAVCQTG